VLSLSHIMATMPYYLAIDAGGTKTQCLIADSDRVLARATTGSVKLMRVPEAEATGRLHAMLDEASATAGISLSAITRTCFGLAGLSIPSVRAWATAAIAARTSSPLILCGDEEIALDAAFAAGPGILVIAGTGSNVIGRSPSGSLHSAGGWGPILGDEGGGYWIGLESIRYALNTLDKEPAPEPGVLKPGTPEPGAPSLSPSFGDRVGSNPPGATPAAHLLAQIQRHFNLNSLAELIELGNHRGDAARPAPDFASLAPTIAASAEAGNPVASAILHQAGAELATLVALVASKLAAPPNSILPPSNLEPRTLNLEVAFTGSVLTHIPAVRDAMTKLLSRLLPSAQVQPAPVDPLDGALWRARHA
jgi:glucosamine kinase